jgi:hypothetical protein
VIISVSGSSSVASTRVSILITPSTPWEITSSPEVKVWSLASALPLTV